MARAASGSSRRRFFKQGFGVGAGALALGRWPRGLFRRQQAGAPLIITSHTNETGRNAMAQAWGHPLPGRERAGRGGARRQRDRGGSR